MCVGFVNQELHQDMSSTCLCWISSFCTWVKVHR